MQADGVAALESCIHDAHALGISLIWLLGDPTWILPEHRDALLTLVRAFRSVPFDGIHLDLEPDQLPQAKGRRAELAGHMLDTVNAVIKESPWPLGLSLHPRYLRPKGSAPWLAAELRLAGVREVAVMAYIVNQAQLQNTMRTVIRHMADSANPKALRTGGGKPGGGTPPEAGRGERPPAPYLTLAQSFEPGMGKQTSHASAGRPAFDAWLRALRQEASMPVDGLLIQAWEDYHRGSEKK